MQTNSLRGYGKQKEEDYDREIAKKHELSELEYLIIQTYKSKGKNLKPEIKEKFLNASEEDLYKTKTNDKLIIIFRAIRDSILEERKQKEVKTGKEEQSEEGAEIK